MERQSTVLIVANYFFGNSSASIAQRNDVAALIQSGYKAIVLGPRRLFGSPLLYECMTLQDVARAESFPDRDQPNVLFHLCSIIGYFSTIRIARQILKRRNPRAVIAMYHPAHIASFCGYLISAIFKLPLIIRCHDLIYPPCPGFIRRASSLIITTLFNSLSFRRARTITVVSSEQKTILKQFYKCKGKIVILPNTVDTHVFKPMRSKSNFLRELGLEGKRVVLLVEGSSHALEGQPITSILSAFREVAEKREDIRLVIIGRELHKSELRRLVLFFQLGDYVMVLEDVSHKDIVKVLSLGHIAFGPMNAPNGAIPLSSLEYMACGIPVIAARGCISKDLLEPRYNGLIVDPRETHSLISALETLLSNARLTHWMGENARCHVHLHFSISVAATILAREIDSLSRLETRFSKCLK